MCLNIIQPMVCYPFVRVHALKIKNSGADMHYTVYTRIWCMTERLKGQLLFLVILLTIYYWLPFVYHHKLIHGQLSMSKERRCAQEHSHCFKSFDALWTSFVFAVMICTTRRASSILLVNSRFVLCSISRGWCHFTHSSRKVQGHSTNSIVHHPLFVRQTL